MHHPGWSPSGDVRGVSGVYCISCMVGTSSAILTQHLKVNTIVLWLRMTWNRDMQEGVTILGEMLTSGLPGNSLLACCCF